MLNDRCHSIFFTFRNYAIQKSYSRYIKLIIIKIKRQYHIDSIINIIFIMFFCGTLYKSFLIHGECCAIRFIFSLACTLTYNTMINIGKVKAHFHKTIALARTIIFTIIIFRSNTG